MIRALVPTLLLPVSLAFVSLPILAQTTNNPPVIVTPTPGTEGSITPPFARGILTRLDIHTLEFSIKISTNEQIFHFTPNTYIFRETEKLTAEQLKPGDFLKLRFITGTNGWLIVNRIKIDTNAPMPSLRGP